MKELVEELVKETLHSSHCDHTTLPPRVAELDCSTLC